MNYPYMKIEIVIEDSIILDFRRLFL